MAEKIKWVDVTSSNLDKISYSEKDQKLYIQFKQRKEEEYYVYEYVDVVTFNALMVAESKGRFFFAEIRNRFKYTKVEE